MTGWNLSQISRTAWNLEHQQSEADRLRLNLLAGTDLDDTQLELFAQYVEALQGIGVDLQDERLQEAINAYPENMEAAIDAVLNYADYLRQKHEEFSNPTSCLKQAFEQGWAPFPQEESVSDQGQANSGD